jgi:hypothetical protein
MSSLNSVLAHISFQDKCPRNMKMEGAIIIEKFQDTFLTW